MTTELKPCPFCGKTPEFRFIGRDDDRYYVSAEIHCCVKMVEYLPFNIASDMSNQEAEYKLKLISTVRWNTMAL